MKIGILTYHRAENYGALLQAYAMRTYLQSLGHEVEFVDYWPKYHSDYFKISEVSFRLFQDLLAGRFLEEFPEGETGPARKTRSDGA